MSRRSRGGRPASLLPLVLAVTVVATPGLAGCADDPNSIAAQAKAGDRKGYVSGDGSVEQIPVDRRGAPVDLKGTTLDGASWASATERGRRAVVVNVWGSWCGPCEGEAPHLEKVWQETRSGKQPVTFMGVNFREPAENGRAGGKAWGQTFPSLSDPDGIALLALQGKLSGAPGTIILDREGRIAARVVGAVTSPATLQGLVDDVVAEDATAGKQ